MKATTRSPAFSAAPAPTSERRPRRLAINSHRHPQNSQRPPQTRPVAAYAAGSAVVRAALVGALLVASFHLPLSAHHSFAAEFDAAKPVTLTGTVVRLEWTNPHAWLYLDVRGEDGNGVEWALELSAPSALARRGLRPDVARPGTKLVVKGYAAKNGTPRARALLVMLAGGRVVELAQ
jgi:uncharacterized protein DUF6152